MVTKKGKIAKKQAVNRRRNGQFALGNKAGKKFQPGESGNRQGRPKRTKLSEALIAQLAEMAAGASEETNAEKIAQMLIAEGLKGNVQAIREIADRTEGKPRQAVDVDMKVFDWRAIAQEHGITEGDVLEEAQRLIESALDPGGEEPG